MERYITQLLDDLEHIISFRQATDQQLAVLTDVEESPDDALELSKLLNTRHSSFMELLELDIHHLPPHEMLSDKNVKDLFDRLSDALMVHNCYLDFPAKISSRERYKTLRDYWNEPQQIYDQCINTIEFCDYDQDTCPFGPGKCQCKDFEDLG